ncbi:pentapeptide repeat-containing protein [Campylobacter jejuni]|nr:pentapeptide repeat-containing protein [Campylobacter jejuni]
MENFDKKLAQYGILAKNGEIFLEDNKITIINVEIKEINFQTLQEAGIKELCILESEIKYLYFLEKNTIKIDFRNCNFKNQIITRKAYFENEVIFHQCVFDAIVDFSKVEFNSKIDFLASVFKGEVRFIGTQFQAEQSNNEIIENDFREVIFEGRASFSNATFKARVSFALSQFKSEANFIKTEFQANQNDSDIIENQFLEVVFIGKIIFDHATFKARVSFRNSQFKEEVRFIRAQFLAEQSNNKIIENIFEEVVFEERVSFDNAIFNARVSFRISQFKNETIFTNTKFQANQNDSDIIENQFLGVVFIGRTIFNHATFKARVGFRISQFKEEVRFIETQFLAKQSNNETIENDFREVIFEGRASFSNTTFKARVSFGLSQFKEEVRFIGVKFQAEQSSNLEIIENEFRETIFKGKVAFDSLVLKARISFLFSTFKDEALFLNINPNNCIFHNVEFNKINFIHIDDINAESNAESYVFQNSVFKDALSFKGMEFERLGFDNVLFNGVVTFSNTKLNTKPQFINCTFSNQFNIEHQYIKYSDKDIENKINNIQDKNDKFRALLNLRDLFRKLKSNRIAHHNLIDASELRTQELYARELELKYKENKSLREKIERWQLFFYRKLCDHHTDILQSLNSLILVIGIFVLSSVVMVVCFNYRLGYKPILEHLYFSLDFYNHHINSIIQDNYLFVVKVNFAMLFGYLILVGFALCLKYMREFFIIISYVITLSVLAVSPKILIPAMGFFTDKRAMLDPLSTMGGIYTIVFGFVVFSFIKTIRKNSIVPS